MTEKSISNDQKPHYFRDFWKFIKPYKKPLRNVYLLNLMNAFCNMIPAYSIRFYIDCVLMGNSAEFLGMTIPAVPSDAPAELKVRVTLLFAAGMILFIVFANTIGVVMWRLGTRAVERVIYDIKVQIHSHINKLSLRYIDTERTGDVMTKAVGDVQSLSNMLHNSVHLTYHTVVFITAPVLMISVSWHLFLIVLIPVPLILYAMHNIRTKLKPMYRTQREHLSDINSQLQESIAGIREVKAFNMEKKSKQKYTDANWKYYDMQNRIMKVFSVNHQIEYGSTDLGITLMVAAGGIYIFYQIGGVTAGAIASFIGLSHLFYQPVKTFASFFNILQQGMVSLERVIDFLRIDPDVKDMHHAHTLQTEAVKGEIEYKNVSFAYEEGKPILEDISFKIPAGRKVAVVGPSGSGKSTLLSLLMRFYDVDSGSVLLDGIDIRELKQSSLRRQIGIVFQETFLFYGTIWDNLHFVNPHAQDHDILEACRAADILDSIEEMPDGFNTRVGERGVTLSGGQKQRLAIARVFVKNPKIVILDEATSAVDTVTEFEIQKEIERMLEGRTAFIIAHRLSTVRNCDMILVMDQGRIIQSGTHDELANREGTYKELVEKNLF